MSSAQSLAEPVDTTGTVLPPGPRLPAALQGIAFVVNRRRTMARLSRRYGRAFTMRLPVFGPTVMIADPTLAKTLFTTPSTDIINVQPNLGRVLGKQSFFAIEGAQHRRHRKLLTPPLHGKRIKAYESVVAEEFAAEAATWPVGVPFITTEPMMRMTLNIILRTVFGAQGAELDRLREIMPAMVEFGSRMATMPELPVPMIPALRRIDPRQRFLADRAEHDATIGALITAARNDPGLADRDDILALMLSSRFDDGSELTDAEITDELLTLLAAGHETTANTLAWAVERLQRHPEVLDTLVAEVDAGGSEYRTATIQEIQRSRPVIDFAARHVIADHLTLGQYRIPKGHNVMVSISLLHDDAGQFANPERFDPTRFLGSPPSAAWLPFGGGRRRCIGAAFAHMEMDVVLANLLREFTIETTSAPGEKWHSRGVAYAPRDGGRVVLRRRE